MSDQTISPLQDNYTTTISQALAASASALTIYVNTAPTFSFPASTQCCAVINPGKTNMEVVKISAYDSSAKTLTVPASGRAQAMSAGVTATVQAHSVGSTILISDSLAFWTDLRTAINSKVDNDADDTITANTTWSTTTKGGARMNNITTAQRDALAAPANGMIIYNTTTGEMNQYIGGAWSAMASGSTQPNASTTVAGKVEEATQSENDAGTAAGASADLFATPAANAATIQKNAWLYAADAGASDAYAITLAPALAAYVTGQVVYFKANTANTGAASLNVNALGAKTIKKNNDQDLATGDIEAAQLCAVIYDGTNFQLLSDSNPLTTKGDILAGTGTGGTSRLAVGTDGQVLIASSGASTGLAWSSTPTLTYNKKILNIYTNVAIATSSAETTLATVSVAGGLLGTDNIIKGRLWISAIRGVNSGTTTFRLKYGATTLLTQTFNLGNSVYGSGYYDFELRATGATNSQEAQAFIFSMPNVVNNTFPVCLYDFATSGTAAIDSTSAQTLAVTAQYSVSDVSNALTMSGGHIALIQA